MNCLMDGGVKNLHVSLDRLSAWTSEGRYPYGINSTTDDDVNYCLSEATKVYHSVESDLKQHGII